MNSQKLELTRVDKIFLALVTLITVIIFFLICFIPLEAFTNQQEEQSNDVGALEVSDYPAPEPGSQEDETQQDPGFLPVTQAPPSALLTSTFIQYYESNTASPTYSSNGEGLTRSGGVNYYNGRKETWYSQRVLPGGGLNIPGRHVAEDGTIRDENGYIAVAASDLPYGTEIETSLGIGKVYDTGCAPGTTDIYTDW